MKKRRSIYLQILFYVLFIAATLLFIPNSSADLWQGLHNCAVYDEGWTIDSRTSTYTYDALPTFCYIESEGQDLWLTKTLSNVKDDDCLGFFSFQQQIHVALDGEEIYKFIPAPYANSETPGNKWNFIPLNADDNGKTLTIHIYQCYANGRVTVPTMYYGTQAGIMLNYLSAELPRIYLSLAMVFVGCLLGLFHLMKHRSTLIGDSIKWLALFAIFRGIWSYIESNTYSFFISRLLLISQISYLSLKIAVTLYLQFLNQTFHEGKNRFLRVLTICSVFEFFVTFALQFFGIADYAHTVAITHIIMLTTGIYTCGNVIGTLRKHQNDKNLFTARRHYTYLVQLLCTFLIVATSLTDLVRYYTTNSPDVARYSRVGDFIYVLITSLGLFLDFVYLLKMGQKAAIIKEEASIDPMTKLNNRAAFEKEIERGNKRLWANRGIIILDLNNLKLFNDKNGHDAGDDYIITAGQIIHDTFAPFGLVYRIGGDEFCVIAKYLTMQQFQVLQASMEDKICSKNANSDTLPMAIASGYATFDPQKDSTLHDTLKRADEAMYKRKEELKSL